jgi:hypothetical protein
MFGQFVMGVTPRECGESLSGKVARLPPRYRRLARAVLRRLPHDWLGGDGASQQPVIEWALVVSEDIDITPHGCIVLASATRDTFETIQCWTLTLYRRVLDELSDMAVRWVIAHEFGYVAARISSAFTSTEGAPFAVTDTDSNEYDNEHFREIRERRANVCALGWGFIEEKAAYDRELPML